MQDTKFRDNVLALCSVNPLYLVRAVEDLVKTGTIANLEIYTQATPDVDRRTRTGRSKSDFSFNR